jgi:predicted Zn-dependent protease
MTAALPQELVEHALATSRADSCIAITHLTSSANLRWANNTLTTNGVMRRCTVTVISFRNRDGGTAVGSVSGTAATRDQVTGLVEAADAAAAVSTPAEDAAELIVGDAAADWQEPFEETSIKVYADFAPALGEAFRRAGAAGRILYGFVDHDVTTTYLGSSTGLRLRHVQPTGHWGCTGKTADLSSSAWVGGATRDFRDVDAAAIDAELERRLGWSARRIDLPAGRYDTVLPPTAVADLMIYAYWTASARDADEGRNVYAAGSGGTRIGEQLASLPLTLRSDPGEPGLQCPPFEIATSSGDLQSVFDNGQPVAATRWIDEGKLANLIRTRAWARKTDAPPVPAADNLILDGATDGPTL